MRVWVRHVSGLACGTLFHTLSIFERISSLGSPTCACIPQTTAMASQTIEKKPSSLEVDTFDLQFEVDPLFKKTSASFDEGGVEGLLLNHLCVR